MDLNFASICEAPEFKGVVADDEHDIALRRAELAARPKYVPLNLYLAN